jgi:hypothetical protein
VIKFRKGRRENSKVQFIKREYTIEKLKIQKKFKDLMSPTLRLHGVINPVAEGEGTE